MEKKKIYKIAALKEAWKIFTSNFWFLLGVFIFVIVAWIASQFLLMLPMFGYLKANAMNSFGQELQPPKIFILYSIISTFLILAVIIFFQIGPIKIILKLIDRQKALFSDIFKHYRLFFKYLLLWIIFLAVYIGFFFIAGVVMGMIKWISSGHFSVFNQVASTPVEEVLFPVTAIIFTLAVFYLMIKYGFSPFIIVDKELGPIDALKESAKITRGAKIQILLFLLLVFVIIYLPLFILFFASMYFVITSESMLYSGIPITPIFLISLAFQVLNICALITFLTADMIVYRLLDQQTNPEEYAISDDEGAAAIEDVDKVVESETL